VLPDHIPVLAVSRRVSCAVPVIDGATVLDGGSACTIPVAAEPAVLAPSRLLPVTFTRTVAPTFTEARVYDCAVAPEMLEQLAPMLSQACHWSL
jgi:hypothetical protein